MNTTRIIVFLLLTVGFAKGYSQSEVIRLWDGKARGSENSTSNETEVATPHGRIIQNVVDPSLSVFMPDEAIQTGTAVIVCPGGGFRSLSWDSEGVEAAKWLNSKGIIAFVLKYRTLAMDQLPVKLNIKKAARGKVFDSPDKVKYANVNPSPRNKALSLTINMAIDDALKAISVVRAGAEKWHVNTHKIGFLGFSAGGGVAIGATVQELSAPNFVATAYGPAVKNVVNIRKAPPLFMAVASYHPNVSIGCVALYNEWKKAGNSVELHLYGKGNKPFGMGNDGLPSDEWKDQFYKWLIAEGF